MGASLVLLLICMALNVGPVNRIVEFGSQEDCQRAIRELSEQPLLGRPVFIREVCPSTWQNLWHAY